MFSWLYAHSMTDLGTLLQGVGAMLTAIAVFVGFVFTVKQLKENERQEREHRRSQSLMAVTDVYRQFYQTDKLDQRARRDFEYEFFNEFAPVMEKSLVYPVDLNEVDKEKLVRVDALLNFFEHIAYLSENSDFLDIRDMDAMFSFWFRLMKAPTHVVLERYLLDGFESLQKRLDIKPQPVLLAAYGTLMEGEPNSLSEKFLVSSGVSENALFRGLSMTSRKVILD
jgi:hypothetical protein